MRIRISTALAVTLAASLSARADDAPKGHCPITGKAAVAGEKKEIDGYTYYFCCPGCSGAFDKTKHAAVGNYQLAVTKQIKQKACPLTGEAVDPATKIKIGASNVEVAFCCAKCQAKVEAAKDDKAKVELVFKDISKGFEKAPAN